MGDDLDGGAKIIAASFGGHHGAIDLAGGNIVTGIYSTYTILCNYP